ncbi:TlpA family protein disulfide reductase, partial [Carboxylicivirga marina]|uniref:TlpA family protein disulfide reductase n=1 Tax=Carboxylicivirga marina TaxID=2800988 RepID=UPI00259507C5
PLVASKQNVAIMNNTVKTLVRLILGISVAIIISLLIILLYFYGLRNIADLKINNFVTLKWIPMLMCTLGFYLAGVINRKTKLAAIPILFFSLIFQYQLQQVMVVPWLLIIVVSSLSLVITRKEISTRIRTLSLLTLILTFGYNLLSQPLIIEHEKFGHDLQGNLYNATVLWDFSDEPSSRIPTETFIDEYGNEFNLKRFEGKTLYVTFWATWCGACLIQKPALDEMKEFLKEDSNLVFIDISIDPDIKAWKSYIAEHEPAGIQLLAKNKGSTQYKFQFSGVPHNIVVSPDGRFREYHSPLNININLLTDTLRLNDFMNSSYKVFKTIKINDKDSIVRVK